MKCKILFKGKVILHGLRGDESVEEIKKLLKNNLDNRNFLFNNFKYEFEEDVE